MTSWNMMKFVQQDYGIDLCGCRVLKLGEIRPPAYQLTLLPYYHIILALKKQDH